MSQPTVSRALNCEPIRSGEARRKLFNYLEINEYCLCSRRTDAKDAVLGAFEKMWDHTEGHARAVARVIDALGEFRPTKTGDKGNAIDGGKRKTT